MRPFFDLEGPLHLSSSHVVVQVFFWPWTLPVYRYGPCADRLFFSQDPTHSIVSSNPHFHADRLDQHTQDLGRTT